MNLLTHSRKRKSALKIFSILMTAILIFSPGGLLAGSLPSGQSVVKGKVTITTNGNVMDIDQASQKAIVNWQKFNIGEGYTVNVNQINKTAAMLARVIGNDPSKILGNLNATGHFYLINQNGIFFGQNARINVGALIASTMDIKDDDFMAGQLNFFGESTASVINAGQINADAVALLGKDVQNLGTINANQVGLVAAQKAVTLGDFGGGAKLIVDFSDFDKATDAAVETSIINKGIVNAGEDGDVVLFAEAGTASNEEGYVKADSLEISGDFVDLNKLGNFDVNNLLIDPTGTLTILGYIEPIIDTNGNVDWDDGYTGNDGDQTISQNHLNNLATETNLTLMFDNFVLNTILDITASPGRTLTFSTNNYAAGDGTFNFNNRSIDSVQNIVINAGSIGGNAIIKTPDNNRQDVTLNVYNGFTVGADGKVITLTSTTGFINSLDGADRLNASEELRLNAKTGMNIVSVSPIISVGDSDGDITIYNNNLTNNTAYLRLRALDGNDINAASFSLRNYNDVLIENAIDITGALSIEARSSNIAGDIVSSNPSAVAGQNNSVGDIGIMATIRAGSITLDADGIVITSSLPAEAATLTA
ncbi:MAG: filamentous hemagglutinin N-terminal domain-containing protein, partial [Lentisphaerae bacterium]|nr:filamentous hemagglutinin N-terminal domain-containing protein [Lentisphaerota bacterium]